MKEYTSGEMTAVIAEEYDWQARTVFDQVNRWLARGDGIAVYRNEDLSSPDVGEHRLASFGSDAAMLTMEPLPSTLPDTPTVINWRYQLHGTYRGDPLTIPVDLPEKPAEEFPPVTSEDDYREDDEDDYWDNDGGDLW